MAAGGVSFVRFSAELHSYLLEEITSLLHLAYRPLADAGMRFFASHQDSAKTLERLCRGEGYLAFLGGELVGTVSLYREQVDSACLYYRRPGVFCFGQLAVHPRFQGLGYGTLLLDFVESRASQLGASELALDTAETAHHLISIYEKRGYRQVETVKWDVTNYLSVILSKKL